MGSGGKASRGGRNSTDGSGNAANEAGGDDGEPPDGDGSESPSGGRDAEPGSEPNGGDDGGEAPPGAAGESGAGSGAEAVPLRWIGPCAPLAVSDDGQTALARGGIWTAKDGWQALPDLPGGEDRNTPRVMSGDGRVVYGSSASELGDEIYRWTRADGIEGLGQVYTPSAFADDFPYPLHTIDTNRDGLMLTGFGTFLGGTAFRWTPADGFKDLPFSGLPSEDAALSAVVSADGTTTAFTGSGANGLPVVLSTSRRDVSVSDATSSAFPTAVSGDGHFVALYYPDFGGVNGLPLKDPEASGAPAVCLTYGPTCAYTNVVAFGLDTHGDAAVGVEFLGGMGDREPVGTFYWSRQDGIWHLSERLLLDGTLVDVRMPSAVFMSSNARHVLAQGTRYEDDGSSSEECFIATLSGEPVGWDPGPEEVCADADCPRDSIAASGNNSCAVDAEGTVRCWGELAAAGSEPLSRGWSPLEVDLPGPAAQVSVGAAHACAALRDGTVQCWGDNSSGQLGDGTVTSRSEPAEVTGLSDVTQVVSNAGGSCALLADHSVQCWGHRVQDVDVVTAPIAVEGVSDAVQLAASGDYTCALLADGSVSCWGEFYYPAAETYAYAKYFPSATPIPELGGVTRIAAGPTSICALAEEGTVTCWGALLHAFEELVPAPVTSEVGLTKVEAPADTVKLAISTNALCALLADGSVQCSGWNQRGLLGSGDRHSSLTLRPVIGLAGAVDLALGASHACARQANGAVRCWGSNDYGQLGIGAVFKNEPASVAFPVSARLPHD